MKVGVISDVHVRMRGGRQFIEPLFKTALTAEERKGLEWPGSVAAPKRVGPQLYIGMIRVRDEAQMQLITTKAQRMGGSVLFFPDWDGRRASAPDALAFTALRQFLARSGITVQATERFDAVWERVQKMLDPAHKLSDHDARLAR